MTKPRSHAFAPKASGLEPVFVCEFAGPVWGVAPDRVGIDFAMENDSWQVFQRAIDDKPASAMVETSWTDEGPDQERPVCLIVRIPFETGDDSGLPDNDEEFEQINLITEGLMAALKRNRAVLTGKLMHDSVHSLYFYAADEKGVEEAVAGVIARFKGREADVTCIDDPDWERVSEDVWPTELEQRWNEDMLVISALEENGDDMTTPRAIEHMAIFASSEACEQFAQWCGQNGFEVSEQYQSEDFDDGAFLIDFTRESAPTIEEIFEQTSAAAEAAEELGGMYDGWQCALVTNEQSDE